MRIVCEQCHTKYVYPDEKIVKSKVRFTCQKCGHVIMASRPDDPHADDASQSNLGKWQQAGSLHTPRRGTSEAPTWYYSQNGESFGPLTETELIEKLRSLDGAAQYCYVWRKSFSEWRPVLDVEPFASAVMMPPPPPAPAPVPKPASSTEGLPPLFSDRANSSRMSPKVSGARTSSPDLLGLKNRLRGSDAEAADTNDCPTHQGMPALESFAKLDNDLQESSEESTSDTTRVGAPSPFFTFPDITPSESSLPAHKSESESGKLPSISRLAVGKSPIPKPKDNNLSSLPAFGSSSKPAPGIASIFAAANSMAKSPSVPRFAGLQKIAAGSSSASLPGISAKDNGRSVLPFGAAAAKKNGAGKSGDILDEQIDLTDFKEDIGDIVKEDSPSKSAPDAERDESISSWLPSQSAMPSLGSLPEVDRECGESESGSLSDFSLGDFKLSPSVVNCEDADKEVPTIELGISLDDHEVKDDDGGLNIEDIDLSSCDTPAQISEDAAAAASDSLPDQPVIEDEPEEIDLDEDPSELHSEEECRETDEEVRMSDGVKDIADIDLDEDLADIDLDEDEASQILMPSQVEQALANSDDSGIIDDADSLFGSEDRGENEVARVSHIKLDEIAAKREALFAAIEAAGPSPEESCEISENSQLIQLAHFEKLAKEDNKKSGLRVIAAVAGIVIAVAVIALLIGSYESGKAVVESGTDKNFDTARGTTITSDDLNKFIPEDDFQIVAAETHHHRSSHKVPKNDDAAPQDDVRESPDNAAPDVNAEALNAIYGEKKDQAEDTSGAPLAAVRSDGRANVVFRDSGDFASTKGLKGSKYQNIGGAPSEREKFTLGLKSVSATVQECHRREAKNGRMNIPKIYIQFKVEPSGKVNEFNVEQEGIPETFKNCLEAKKDRWKFAPFEGDPVRLRQGFVLY